MERLTKKESAGYDLIKLNDEWCNEYCRDQTQETCNHCAIYEAIQKLADYEETGVTPEEIKTTKKAIRFFFKKEIGKFIDMLPLSLFE